jgi:hypothetical protein
MIAFRPSQPWHGLIPPDAIIEGKSRHNRMYSLSTALFTFSSTACVIAASSAIDIHPESIPQAHSIHRSLGLGYSHGYNGTGYGNVSDVDLCYLATDKLVSSNTALLDATRHLNEYSDNERDKVYQCVDSVLAKGSAASGTSCNYDYWTTGNGQVYRDYAEACADARIDGVKAGALYVWDYTIDCQSNSSQEVQFSVSRMNYPYCYVQKKLEPSCEQGLLDQDCENYVSEFLLGVVERGLPVTCVVRASNVVPAKDQGVSTIATVGIVFTAIFVLIIGVGYVVSNRNAGKISSADGFDEGKGKAATVAEKVSEEESIDADKL